VAGWEGRRDFHDKKAVPMVVEVLDRYGIEAQTIGTETDNAALRELLRDRTDATSLMLRFRPDKVTVPPIGAPLMLEVKSKGERYENFAVEVNSYLAALLHQESGVAVWYAFVEVHTARMFACWLPDIPEPWRIDIPKRPDWEEGYRRVRERFPCARTRFLHYVPGWMSGTPQFLIPKASRFLRPLEQFIEEEILGKARRKVEAARAQQGLF
jgi:hypothetical protein